MAWGAQDVVSCDGCRAVLFPSAPVAADGSDPVGPSVDNRAVAPARVPGTIRGDGIERFVWRDLLQQFRQQGAVSLAARSELERANLPLAVAPEFDAGAVDQEVQRLPGCTLGICTAIRA